MNGLRITLAASIAAAALSASTPAHADETKGFTVGVRTGYAAPLGDAYKGVTMGSFEGGMLPFWFDLGWRFNPNWYLGIWYQYGITAPPNSRCAPISGISDATCDGNDQRFGINVHYHIMPDKIVDPWVGLGLGYEVARFNYESAIAGGGEQSIVASGFQFVDLQAGADLRFSDKIPFGPFIDFSFGQLGSVNVKDANGNSTSVPNVQTAMHEWLLLGLRAQFNL